jgi:DNA-directed RNA polymerase subunit RPC12/RpoP
VSSTSDRFIELYDASGSVVGVFIGPELWKKTRDAVLPVLEAALPAGDPEPAGIDLPPEPIEDWETLVAYWDFPYPPAYDLVCDHCGSRTEDWRKDTPRKFRLTAASMGGQTSFECLTCRARIIKRHFKKHVDVECRPFVDRT